VIIRGLPTLWKIVEPHGGRIGVGTAGCAITQDAKKKSIAMSVNEFLKVLFQIIGGQHNYYQKPYLKKSSQ